MNVDTGHLIRLEDNGPVPDGYDEVPQHLNRAARRKLNGSDEAYVSLASGGKLSKWAAEKRRHRNKIAKKSRKQNRRK